MVRHKHRYITAEIKETEKKDGEPLKLRDHSLYRAITDKVKILHGDFGVAAIKAGLNTKYCNERTRIVVIRVRHGPHQIVASTLPFITVVDKKNVSFRTLYTGASIKQCFKFLINYQQVKYNQYCCNLKSDEEKLALKKEIMNIDTIMEINKF